MKVKYDEQLNVIRFTAETGLDIFTLGQLNGRMNRECVPQQDDDMQIMAVVTPLDLLSLAVKPS